jgi:hypothetical protein
MSTAIEPTTPDSRDGRGRFKAGNPGGPGNPFGRYVGANRKEVFAHATPERIRMLLDRIFALAMEGSIAAAKFYFSYAVGKPVGMDREQPEMEELTALLEAAPLEEEIAEYQPASAPPAAEPPAQPPASPAPGARLEAMPLPAAEQPEPAASLLGDAIRASNTVLSPSPNGDSPPLNRRERRALKKLRRQEAKSSGGRVQHS